MRSLILTLGMACVPPQTTVSHTMDTFFEDTSTFTHSDSPASADPDEYGCVPPEHPVFYDLDGDRVGGAFRYCDSFRSNILPHGDCNDQNADVHPYVDGDYFDETDNDCDGMIDEDEPLCGKDVDGDGYAASLAFQPMRLTHDGFCAESWYVPISQLSSVTEIDCDDQNFDANPGALEQFLEIPLDSPIPDQLLAQDSMSTDENCDGMFKGYVDQDGDGYGFVVGESPNVADLSVQGGDCDDEDSDTFPLWTELDRWDGKDNNCNGLADELTCRFTLFISPMEPDGLKHVVQVWSELDQGQAPDGNDVVFPEKMGQFAITTSPIPDVENVLNDPLAPFAGSSSWVLTDSEFPYMTEAPVRPPTGFNHIVPATFAVTVPGELVTGDLTPPKFFWFRQIAFQPKRSGSSQPQEGRYEPLDLQPLYPQDPVPQIVPALEVECGCIGCPEGQKQFYTTTGVMNTFTGRVLFYQTDTDPNAEWRE